jgi:L-arabonate dehydrase
MEIKGTRWRGTAGRQQAAAAATSAGPPFTHWFIPMENPMVPHATRRRRSQEWFGDQGFAGFEARSWMRRLGISSDQFDGRPVIGICNTWSELTPCNSHFRDLARHVREGVLEAGGLPLEFPVMSLGETLMRPTTMLFRNLVSMDVEETLRANPLDGVVLLMGCDKTTPALLMGAASVDLPTIGISGGPMLNGCLDGKKFGVAQMWTMGAEVMAGRIGAEKLMEAEMCLNRSHGHCNVMGTASTMACMVEVLGVGLPANAAIPAADSRRGVLARAAGRRVVEMVTEDLRLRNLLTRQAFENAIQVNAAIGGSTNAVIHLTALARRCGVPLALDDWDALAKEIPTLVNLQPSGTHLMQDFHEAGGLPVVIRELAENGFLHRDAMTANGRTIWENNCSARCDNREVIRSCDDPLMTDSGIAVLRGNLCPDGAVIKPSAATPGLLRHAGPAVVFDDVQELHRRFADPTLPITEQSVMVLRNCGPCGFPGMPEVGNMPIPPKLLAKGIKDMVRISDARMSGTAFGTVVLHVSPESAVGGPLALVRDGDLIELDVPARRLSLRVDEEELARRRSLLVQPAVRSPRGYERLYFEHVNQASEGADLDFLVGCSGSGVPKSKHPPIMADPGPVGRPDPQGGAGPEGRNP